MAAKSARTVSPVPLMEDVWGVWRTFTVVAAMDLDVFSHIAEGAGTAAEVASRASANDRYTGRLLDALVGLGYLGRKGDKYSLQPIAKTFLTRSSKLYMDRGAEFARMMVPMWFNLPQAVRTGRPVVPQGGAGEMKDIFPTLVKSIFPMNYNAAQFAADAIPAAAKKRIAKILDVAAGSGAWSLPFAEKLKNARITVVDFPGVTEITREYAEKHGVADHYDYIDGDIRQTDFGQGIYDLIILGHIIHSEGAEFGRKLIEKVQRCASRQGSAANRRVRTQ